jgi:hypothetical protein
MRLRQGGSSLRKALVVVGAASVMGLTFIGVGAVDAANSSAGPPTTTHNVKPTFSAGQVTSCPKGTTTFISTLGTKPGDQSRSYSTGGTTFQTTVSSDGTTLSFMTNSPRFTVYIEGATPWQASAGFDTYRYTGTATHPNYPSDTGLHAPVSELNAEWRADLISYYLVCGRPATSVATPTITTDPSAGGTVGTAVLNDTATLAGGTSPTGTITFKLYSPTETCGSSSAAYTQIVTVSGDGKYSTTNSTPAGAVGTWSWTAMYSGDSHNNGASSGCGKETVSISKAIPSLSTSPSPGGTIGKVVLNDKATLSEGYSPTGTITFDLYAPTQSTCTGKPAFKQTVPVAGNGTYSTSNKTKASLAGTWNWVATYSGDGNNVPIASKCGQETVHVATVVPPGGCSPTGSISYIVSGKNVISYVPKGSWDTSTPGIDVVNVEGTSITSTKIPTGTDVINSCASNSTTGITVCVANNNHVYVLKGTALDSAVSPDPLTDTGTGCIGFSGGCPTTSGVAMTAVNNRALIAESLTGVGGFQFLDLSTFTFGAPFKTESPSGSISEDPLIDPVHHFIGSADEAGNFEIVNDQKVTSLKFYEQTMPGLSGEPDSTAEDCSTGILISPEEFSSPTSVFIADIQNAGKAPEATFTTGTPGSWTAPEQSQTLTGSYLSAGGSGSAVAQGTHTGAVSGEFGGDNLTAIALPTTSGHGLTPAIQNWMTCATGPAPTGLTFQMGLDPHTLTAYETPNGDDAIALIVNSGATLMVRVDLTKMLKLGSKSTTSHVCSGTTMPSTVAQFISLP